jgi:predicted nucleotidyltransferase
MSDFETYTNKFINAGKFDQNSMFIKDNLVYETLTGSHAYGTNTEESDIDIVGIFMDRHQDLYPTNYGKIIGFDNLSRFESKEIKGDNKKIKMDNGKDLEGEWHSISNFFTLCGMKGSPNLVETLFTRQNFVTYSGDVAGILRDNRRVFLSMKTYQAFRGYAYGQMTRIRNHYKTGKSDNPKRQFLMDKFHYDCKQAYHLLRLLDQIDQVLTTNDIDLMKNKEQCIACRNGEFGTFEYLEEYFNKKMLALDELSLKVTLPQQPQSGALHNLLQQCIESFYGTIDNSIKTDYIKASDVWERLDKIEKIIIDLKPYHDPHGQYPY